MLLLCTAYVPWSQPDNLSLAQGICSNSDTAASLPSSTGLASLALPQADSTHELWGFHLNLPEDAQWHGVSAGQVSQLQASHGFAQDQSAHPACNDPRLILSQVGPFL